MSIVYFKDIDQDFCYGYFKDFYIIIDKNTGCFNATKLCKFKNKQCRYWLELDRTKELINEFHKMYCADDIYYNIKPNKLQKCLVSGNYICKELFLDLASWISPEFYLKSHDIIFNYFDLRYKSSIKEEELNIIIEQNKKIISQTNLTFFDINILKNKLMILDTKLDKTNSSIILNNELSSSYNPFSSLVNKFCNYFNITN